MPDTGCLELMLPKGHSLKHSFVAVGLTWHSTSAHKPVAVLYFLKNLYSRDDVATCNTVHAGVMVGVIQAVAIPLARLEHGRPCLEIVVRQSMHACMPPR